MDWFGGMIFNLVEQYIYHQWGKRLVFLLNRIFLGGKNKKNGNDWRLFLLFSFIVVWDIKVLDVADTKCDNMREYIRSLLDKFHFALSFCFLLSMLFWTHSEYVQVLNFTRIIMLKRFSKFHWTSEATQLFLIEFLFPVFLWSNFGIFEFFEQFFQNSKFFLI